MMAFHCRLSAVVLALVAGSCKAGSPDETAGETGAAEPLATAAAPAMRGDVARAIDGTRPRVRAAHILISYKGAPRMPFPVRRSKEDAKVRAEQVLKRALSGEDFEKLALAVSDDKTVNANKGSLGYFEPSKLPPPISKTAYALEKGQVAAQLVETGFGFHVLKRTD
jgi:hypothetical protein